MALKVQDLNRKQNQRTDVIGLLTLGFSLLLVGCIFAVTPNLIDRVSDFLQNFEIRDVMPNWKLPAPKSSHPVLYTAIFQFCLTFAIFQVIVLGARLFLRDPFEKQAGTVSSIIFWFGASWIVSLLIAGAIEWFDFLGLLIAFIGASIVIKNSMVLMGRVFR